MVRSVDRLEDAAASTAVEDVCRLQRASIITYHNVGVLQVSS